MSGDAYVRGILSKYAVPTGPNSPAAKAADAMVPTLESWAGNELTGKGVVYSGSYAKGTAVGTGTDVDLFISLKHSAPTLKAIYDSLYSLALRAGWSPRKQNVSIGATYGGCKVDLVPGRVQAGVLNPHSLYLSKSDSWTKTDIFKHISLVSSCGRTEEIRAIKIWRDLHRLEFPSIYLELFVIDALRNQRQGNLASNVLLALRTIADSIERRRIEDPANSANTVSAELTATQKRTLAAQAAASAQQRYWEDIIW